MAAKFVMGCFEYLIKKVKISIIRIILINKIHNKILLMDCECCFDEEHDFQLSINSPTKTYSHKDLFVSHSLNNLSNNPGKQGFQRISLKKKTISSSMPIMQQNRLQIRRNDESVYSRTFSGYPQRYPQQKVIQNNNYIINYPLIQKNIVNFPVITPQSIALPTIPPLPLYYNYPVRFPPNQHNVTTVTPHIIQANKIYQKPNVTISYDQPHNLVKKPISNDTTHTNRPTQNRKTEFTQINQVQPIKVQLQIPTATHINSSDIEKVVPNVKRTSGIRKSSIEFASRDVERNEQFKGKMSTELKKVNSLGEQLESKQKNTSRNLIKSVRMREQHIYDINCIKTQSIKGENDNQEDSLDGLSQVIKQDKDLPDNRSLKLMTNSETKFQKQFERNFIQHKRSIIWQNSRKQSLSQF